MQLTLTLPKGHPASSPVTGIIQQAIDEVNNAGGGTLVLPPGQYLTGALVLPSNFCLHFEPGAELVASSQYEDYLPGETLSVAEQSNRALIYARNQHNISLTGQGRIDGNATAWFSATKDALGYRMPAQERPRIIVFEGCNNVRLQSVRIHDAPMWTVHLVACEQVFISQMVVDNDMTMANTDALDIDSCRYVHISDSHFSAADDGICLKTTRKPAPLAGPTQHVTISGCTLRSASSAFKIGTETVDDIEDIVMTGCTIYDSNRGIGIISRDGGALRRLRFSDITFNCHHANPCHWGRADPVFISCRARDPKVPPGTISQVSFNGISGTAEGAINLHSEQPGDIAWVRLSQVQLRQVACNDPQQGSYDIRPPCNPERPTGTGLDNAFLINPASGEPWGVERYPGGMPAIYATGVLHLALDNLSIERPHPLPAGWHPQAVIQS